MGKMQSTDAEHEEITPAACIFKKTQHFSWKQLEKTHHTPAETPQWKQPLSTAFSPY